MGISSHFGCIKRNQAWLFLIFMSGLFLKAPELVLRNLLYLSEKCKQICLAADIYEVQIALRFRLFPSLPTVLRHSERNSSFDKSQWQPPRRVLPNFSKLFSFIKDMQKSVPFDTLLQNRMIAALEKRHTSPKTHKTKETWLPVCNRKRNKSKRYCLKYIHFKRKSQLQKILFMDTRLIFHALCLTMLL